MSAGAIPNAEDAGARCTHAAGAVQRGPYRQLTDRASPRTGVRSYAIGQHARRPGGEADPPNPVQSWRLAAAPWMTSDLKGRIADVAQPFG
jgi:hypothetical protein